MRMDESNCSSRDDIETVNMSDSAELSVDDKIHPSGSSEMHFANFEEIRQDHRLFDEGR